MQTSITRRYRFAAANFLPKVSDGHKCKRMHGHNYLLEVTVSGPLHDNGFIIDFWDLDKFVQPLVDLLDHRTLNDIPGLGNPTAEYIADWFFMRLKHATYGKPFNIKAIRIYEESDCWADVSI